MKLATRVSAFFLAALAIVVVAFSITLYLLARAYLQHDLDEHLGIALDALATSFDPRLELKAEDPPGSIRQDLHDNGVRWAVFDRQGSMVAGCWKLAADDLAAIYRLRPAAGHIHDSFSDENGSSWRIAVRLGQTPGSGRFARSSIGDKKADQGGGGLRADAGTPAAESGVPLVFAAGAPMGPMEGGLRNVAWVLAGLSAGTWLLAAAVGRRLCDRALLPVTRMAKAACTMTPADSDKHLPIPGTRDELDRLAQAFNGLLDRLQEEFERQKRFTGDASHQLRTPLAGLLGQLEVARRRKRSVEEYQHTLDVVHGEALRLNQIVDALLFMARAETETGRPELDRVELVDWLEEYMCAWSAHPRAADLQVEVTLDGPAYVRVHRQLLGQLVDNLLDNASKYSPPGTPICVKLERVAQTLALAVEDHGPGIAAKDLPHLFEPFFRSAETRRQGQSGVGLGLAVADRIAVIFGGRIRASSSPERGTRFVVELPAADTPAAAHHGPAAVAVADAPYVVAIP
jgi:signal transduction histidine kinase